MVSGAKVRSVSCIEGITANSGTPSRTIDSPGCLKFLFDRSEISTKPMARVSPEKSPSVTFKGKLGELGCAGGTAASITRMLLVLMAAAKLSSFTFCSMSW